MKQVELTLRPEAEPIHPGWERMSESDAIDEVQMLHWNVGEGKVTILFLLRGDAETFQAELDTVSEHLDNELQPLGDGWYSLFTRGRTSRLEEQLYATFDADGLLVVPPLECLAGGGVRVSVLGLPTVLRDTVATLSEYLDVTVEQLGEFDGLGGARYGLTDRQRRTLRKAIEIGYYEIPRRGSVAEIADALGCSQSTVGEHLRKAEAKVMPTAISSTERL